MFKKSIFVFVMIFAIIFSFSAENTVLQGKVDKIINLYWDGQQAFYDLQMKKEVSEEEYLKLSTEIDTNLRELNEYILKNNAIMDFSEIYKNLPEGTKQIFSESVSILIESGNVRSEEELFPGYGYADPGYYYRLGSELKKEVLQKFWKSEERRIEKNTRHKFYIELSVSTQMQQSAEAGGNIEGFDVKGVYGMEINGEFKQVAEVEFTTKDTLTTKAMIAYEKNKVYYELLQAKKSFWDFLPWSDLTWVKCGETYKIHEEATDTQVILNAPEVAGLPSNMPLTDF